MKLVILLRKRPLDDAKFEYKILSPVIKHQVTKEPIKVSETADEALRAGVVGGAPKPDRLPRPQGAICEFMVPELPAVSRISGHSTVT